MLTLERKIPSSRSNQMIKGVHPDFLICAKAMSFAFSAIEKNQAWTLMPSLVPEFALCFHMLQRELNLHCIELEYEKATKQEMKLRAGFAADLHARATVAQQ